MGNDPAGHDAVHEALRAADDLLARRLEPKWDRLSWTTLRPLISSINQVLIAASPDLIPHLRRYWAEKVEPVPARRIVDRSEADCFVFLGDTGEQDRSQYIVVPALREVVERERPDFGFVGSDVIYPSGDVNDYVHGFYLPYGPTPGPTSHPTDPGTGSALSRLPFFAIPGNHDWHDGLSGFMQHLCGTDALEAAQLGWPTEPLGHGGGQWVEAARRMLLRRPARFRPRPLWRGDGDEPYTRPMDLDGFRALRGPRTGQPGSYFAIRMREVLLVAIDTGVGRGSGDSAIDARQGRWLEQVSALPGPKVLLTGNPLLVNAEFTECRIDEPLPGRGDDRPGFATVNQLVDDPAHRYVAVIGGDIHNFQHYVAAAPPGPSVSTRVVHHITSGGGGAYMSATHPIRVVQQIRRQVERARQQEQAPDVPPTTTRPHDQPVPHSLAPTPVESLQHYARLLLPRLWRLERTILAALVGLAAGAWAGPLGIPLPPPADRGPLLAWLVGALAAAVLVRVRLPTRWVQRPGPVTVAYRLALLVWSAAAGAALTVAVSWLDPRYGMRHLGGWAALTAGGAVVAWAVRRTGWWRPPVAPGERVEPVVIGLGALAWAVAVVSARWLGDLALRGADLPPEVAGLPRAWLPAVPAAVVVAVGLIGVLGFILLRPSTPVRLAAAREHPSTEARAWGRWAPPAAYLVQILAAVGIATFTLYPESPARPWAVVCGLLAFPITPALGLVVAVLGLRLACTIDGEHWRRRWGEWGRWGPPGIGVAVLILVVAQLAVSRGSATPVRGALLVVAGLAAAVAAILAQVWRRARDTAVLGGVLAAVVLAGSMLGLARVLDGAALLSVYRVQLGTQLTIVTVLLMTFVVDALRRRNAGRHGYGVPSALAFAALAGVIWLADLWLGWVVRSAVASVVVIVLALMTLVIAHLTYLGAYVLLVDPWAHRDGAEQLTAEQAREFLDWRVDTSRRSPLPALPQRRAKIVFPPTDNPNGPIQRKVSEIFDSDDPPFWKNFLVLRTRPGKLVVDVHIVHGSGTVAEDARVKQTIVIPLISS